MGRVAVLFFLCAALGNAQISLYIPGFEPQPVSADNAGVGSDGRTTWVIHQGKNTDSSMYSNFVGTATLVQGPHDASLTYANSVAQFTIGQRCSFSQNLAICTAEMGGSTAVYTEVVSPVPIQTGSTKSTSTANSASQNSLSLTTSSGFTSASISDHSISHPSNIGTTGTVPSPSAPANSFAPLQAPSLVITTTSIIIFLLSYQAI